MIPYYSDYMNAVESTKQPSMIHVSNTALSRFFRRHLFQRAISQFDWVQPDWWDSYYLRTIVFAVGFCAIVNTDRFGVIPQQCGLSGYNVFYQPRKALIANPLLRGTLEPVIGEQCTLIRLAPDYGGILDLVAYYGDMLALTAETLATDTLNSKLAYVFAAESTGIAESFKKLYDDIASGRPATVANKRLFSETGEPNWLLFQQNIGQNYIAPELLDAMQTLQNQFDTEVGIDNTNRQKRERLNVDEVSANNMETFTKVDMWYNELKDGCRKAREMFPGLELDVSWRVKPAAAEGVDDGDGEA